jgi:type I site-specific restriction-modification system R (restriction) subunit
MPNFISEDQIEQAILQKLRQFNFELLNCCTANPDDSNDHSNRSDKRDVILKDRLREAAVLLNPAIPESAIDEALERLTDKRQAMSPVAANREIDTLIRDGIPVAFENPDGRKEQERVRVIDFNHPEQNRFLAVSQLWIRGEVYYRRPDILLYVNGMPLVFILLKKARMTGEEKKKVKLAAKSLLHRLLEEHPKVLVQDWFKDSQTKLIVRSTVEQVLHTTLPDSYDRLLFKEKCDTVFDMMLQYASSGRKWAAAA